MSYHERSNKSQYQNSKDWDLFVSKDTNEDLMLCVGAEKDTQPKNKSSTYTQGESPTNGQLGKSEPDLGGDFNYMQMLSLEEQNYLSTRLTRNQQIHPSDTAQSDSSVLEIPGQGQASSFSPVTTPTFNIIPPLEDEFERVQGSLGNQLNNPQVPQIFVTSHDPASQPLLDLETLSRTDSRSSAVDSTTNHPKTQKIDYLNFSSSQKENSNDFQRNLSSTNLSVGNESFEVHSQTGTSNDYGYFTASEMHSSCNNSVLGDTDYLPSSQNSPLMLKEEFDDLSSYNMNLQEFFVSDNKRSKEVATPENSKSTDSLFLSLESQPAKTSVKNTEAMTFIDDDALEKILMQSVEPSNTQETGFKDSFGTETKDASPNTHLLTPPQTLHVDDRNRKPRSRSISKNSSGSRSRSISRDRSKIIQLTNQLSVPQSLDQGLFSSDGEFENSEDEDLEEDYALLSEDHTPPKKLTGEDLKCDECDKVFLHSFNLKSHMKMHIDSRPFKCSFCVKAFARQHDKKRHENLHTGEKWYICGGVLGNGQIWGCGKRFARSDALGRHLKTKLGHKCINELIGEFDDNRFFYNHDKTILLQKLDKYSTSFEKIEVSEFETVCKPTIEHNFLKMAQVRAHELKKQFTPS